MEIEKIDKLTNELSQLKYRYNELVNLKHFVEKDLVRFQLDKYINNSNKPFWSTSSCILTSLVYDGNGRLKKDKQEIPIQEGIFKGWYFDFKNFLIDAINQEINDCEMSANSIINKLTPKK